MPIEQISLPQAAERLQADPDLMLLDVRTPEEFTEAHAARAVNIPFIFFDPQRGRMPNPDFLAEVQRVASPDRPLLLGCASGNRSGMAATQLESLGYAQLANIQGSLGDLR